MEILINHFGEVPDDEWDSATAEAISTYKSKLESYPGVHIPTEIRTKNIGRGADWVVVSLTLLSGASTLFFTIPAAHKHVRESLEEWKTIFNEFTRLNDWLSLKKGKTYYPDEYLFLCALIELDKDTEASELKYLGFHRIPCNNPDLENYEDLIFNFSDGELLESVAVSRKGNILWHHTTDLTNDA